MDIMEMQGVGDAAMEVDLNPTLDPVHLTLLTTINLINYYMSD